MAMGEINATIAAACERRPMLAPILHAFEPLLQARDALALELAETMAQELAPPPYAPENAAKGQPLFAEMASKELASPIQLAAERLLPLLGAQEAIGPHMEMLNAFYLAEPKANDARERLVEAIIANATQDLQAIAKTANLPPEILDFTASFIVSAVLRAIAARALPCKGQAAPWDEDAHWREGYCPVCGSPPVISWLDRPSHDENNAYLSGGGGKKHLHCNLCGTNWKFRRGACPACGKEGEGVLEILTEADDRRERIDFCKKCGHYLTGIDLREIDIIPHMDAMAIGMMHLDMAASQRKLQPLKAAFWNTF